MRSRTRGVKRCVECKEASFIRAPSCRRHPCLFLPIFSSIIPSSKNTNKHLTKNQSKSENSNDLFKQILPCQVKIGRLPLRTCSSFKAPFSKVQTDANGVALWSTWIMTDSSFPLNTKHVPQHHKVPTLRLLRHLSQCPNKCCGGVD